MRSVLLAAGLALACSAHANVRHDEGIGFYVGLDTRANVVGGAFNGLPNPNRGRLTMLLDHGDHYHSIGSYSYLATPGGLPVVTDTSTNNQIPESFSGLPPLAMTPGTGLYAGKMRSTVDGSEYAYTGIASTHSLAGLATGSPEDVLYRSSGGRWTGSLTGIEVGLQLIHYTVGLNIGSETDTNIFDGGDTYVLGAGDTPEFEPVFWVDAGAPMGTYTAGFRLVNLADGSDIMDSGRFYFNLAPIPEPSAYALVGTGLALLGLVVRRRR